jgi:hypothetical protein
MGFLAESVEDLIAIDRTELSELPIICWAGAIQFGVRISIKRSDLLGILVFFQVRIRSNRSFLQNNIRVAGFRCQSVRECLLSRHTNGFLTSFSE